MNTIEGKDRQKISKAMRQHGRINPQDREIPKTAAKVPVRFSEADQKKKKKKIVPRYSLHMFYPLPSPLFSFKYHGCIEVMYMASP